MTRQIPGLLRLRGIKEPLPISDLLWIEGDSNYTLFHVKDTPAMLTAKTLVRWESQLPDFIRISRGALVNPKHIQRLRRLSTYQVTVTLSDGTVLPVARRRISYVMRTLTVLN